MALHHSLYILFHTVYEYDSDENLSHLRIGNEDNLLYDAFMLYDLMNRLTEERREETGDRYSYDLVGNRIKKQSCHYALTSGTKTARSQADDVINGVNGVSNTNNDVIIDGEETYCYNERNELTEKKTLSAITEYLYDENGSLVSEKEGGNTTSYQYDLFNRQINVRMPDGKEQENFYDGEGLRAGLKENGEASNFLFLNGEILAECNGDRMPVRRHLSGLGLSHVQTMKDGAYHTYHQDEQGSTAYVTDSYGAVENCYLYDAFGNVTESQESIRNRILYTGQQYDQETGQYYLRARFYNPMLGRFTQEDTYRGDGLNLYAYCGNNPVVYYDPSGHNNTGIGCGNQGGQNRTEETPIDVADGEKVHGNSRSSTKPQHGYEIYDKTTGDVVKTGISGQELNQNGSSPRANRQVNALNNASGSEVYAARVVETNMPNRATALEWEKQNALRLWNEGNSMAIHKRPKPWG